MPASTAAHDDGLMPGWLEGWRLPAAAFFLAFLAWAPTLGNGWVYDDFPFIVSNPWIRSVEHLPALLWDDAANSQAGAPTQFWRPLRNLAFLLDYQVAGLWPVWWHLLNCVWHGLGVAAAAVVARRVGLPSMAALLAAAVFALHPVQAESVAWVKERDGLMSGALMMAAIACGLGRSALGAFSCIALLVLALLAKEGAVVFAPLFALCGWASWRAGNQPATFPARAGAILGGAVALTVLFLVARTQVLGMLAQSAPVGGTHGATLYTMGEVFLRYLGLIALILPAELSYRHLDVRAYGDLLPLLGFAAIALGLAKAWWFRRRNPAIALGVLWFFVAMVPFTNLIPMMQWMAVRFLYVGMFGVGLAVAGLYVLAMRSGRVKAALVQASFGGVLGLLLLLSVQRQFVWRDQASLWTDAYLTNPRNPDAIINYALIRIQAGRFDEADAALAAYPFDPPIGDHQYAWDMRVKARWGLGDRPGALNALREGLYRHPASPALWTTSAILSRELSDKPAEAHALRQILRIDPQNEAARLRLATLEAPEAPSGS